MCDASENGLGACLLQPVAYGTARCIRDSPLHTHQEPCRQLNSSMRKSKRKCFEQYEYGRPTKVETDRKPLESILKKSILSTPKRLQRMMLRLQKYDLDVTYKKGAHMYQADTLSRAYLPTTDNNRDLRRGCCYDNRPTRQNKKRSISTHSSFSQ